MAWERYRLLLALSLTLAALPVSAHAGYVSGEILVKYKPGYSRQSSVNVQALGAAVVKNLDKIRMQRIKLPKSLSVEAAMAKMKLDPAIEYAGPNHILKTTIRFPDDELFQYGYYDWIYDMYIPQWGLYNESGIRADIHAPEAWSLSTGSPNIVIAVIDTGVDYTHPDLSSKIWSNPRETPGNGIDDDHNGYIDDTRGWDFVNWDNDPMDDNVDPYGFEMKIFHGTFSSGIAAAATYNQIGMAGVAWQCPILPIKVMSDIGEGLESDVAAGVVYATDMGAKVLNMSLAGTDDVPVLKDAVDYAWNHGALCVCASGNENSSAPSYPATYSTALAVGASNDVDQRCTAADWGEGGSNYGNYLDVVAPGTKIVSCTSMMDDRGYYFMDGTSASAPFVSGIAALIWSLHPDWSNSQVFNQIIRTSDDISPVGYDIYTGWGRANAYRALKETVTSIASLVDAKKAADGSSVDLKSKVLTTSTGEISNRLYVQEEGRSSGICLYFTTSVPQNLLDGDFVDVSGAVGSFSGERVIMDPIVTKVTTRANTKQKPLMMSNSTVGGGLLGRQAAVVDQYSYPRVMSKGLNNIGMLTKTYGKVTQVAPDWFYLNDGSNLDDGTGYTGVYVYVGTQIVRPNLGKRVAVTGISSCEILSGSPVPRRVLRPRRQTDIRIY